MTNVETLDPLTDTAPALVGSFVLTPAIFTSKESVDDVLEQIRDEAERFKATRDISTPAGRAAIASFAYKIARSKTALDELGKTTVAEWKTKANAVDEERRRIRYDLDALKDDVRAPLDAWEHKDQVRRAEHENALYAMGDLALFSTFEPTVEMIRERIKELAVLVGRNWEEFADRAGKLSIDVTNKLAGLLVDAERKEAERAEQERAECERLQREQQEREERIAREAREAAEKREREAVEAAQRATEQAEQRAAAAERARQNAAAETEHQRVFDHQQALARLRSYQSADAARESSALKASLDNLEGLYRSRDWQEFADEASQACDVSQRSLEQKIATARLREDQERADRDLRITRQAEAILRQRQAEEAAAAEAEQERRENNRRIRTRVRRQIAEAIDKKLASVVAEDLGGKVVGSVPALADFIAGLIIDGEVPHVTVTF